jgi:HK97 family phage major capsid protein
MASTIESGAKTMLFGQLDKYKIREVRGLRLMRMRELYAETDQEGFVAFFRADGNLLDAGVDPVKHMVH